ncbi:MAG TPA: autotransporter outer membrane beta-barrel domain-containing protein [Candidatus Methylacidiphilales bacterium]|nr:autotransporter outer membrane beta-barrel domain-containing protein [Candidatus Methylacidiphilales bacterium]
MKKVSYFVGLCALTGLFSISPVQAQSSSGIQPETAVGLEQGQPDRPSRDVPETSTEYAIASLARTEGNTAGAEDTDVKNIAPAPGETAGGETEDGFSAPEAYNEYKFAHIQDNRTIGFDGSQQNGIAGFDFESFWKTIVGFNFTYSNDSLTTTGGTPTTNFYNSNNCYFFSAYVAKNFSDWVNIGGSVDYGRTDTDWRADSNFIVPFALGQKTTQDTVGLSPFIGVAHTWGAFSFSSTPTYVWDYDHYSFDLTTVNGSVLPGTPVIPNAKTLNQSFLWLNNFEYAVDSKWTLSAQANWTRLIGIENVPTVVTPSIPPLGHQWMSFGAKVEYAFNKDGNAFIQFEHDAFNIHFDDYRIRAGVSYNF